MTGRLGSTSHAVRIWCNHASATPLLVLSACAPNANYSAHSFEPAGFWTGVWHGVGAVGFLLYSLVGNSGIYEIQNTGFAYNAGFVLGLITFVGVAGMLYDAIVDNADLGAFVVIPFLAGATILLVGVIQLAILGVALIAVQLGS